MKPCSQEDSITHHSSPMPCSAGKPLRVNPSLFCCKQGSNILAHDQSWSQLGHAMTPGAWPPRRKIWQGRSWGSMASHAVYKLVKPAASMPHHACCSSPQPWALHAGPDPLQHGEQHGLGLIESIPADRSLWENNSPQIRPSGLSRFLSPESPATQLLTCYRFVCMSG